MMKGQQYKREYKEKVLSLAYEDYIARGRTLQNMVIDKYVIYNIIGEGSNGQVYRGMDDQTKTQVALKLMNLRDISQQTNPAVKSIRIRLSQSQPKLMYMCNSPHLLKCYDVYKNDDLKLMVIEYCNGKTLQGEIDDKKRLTESQAVGITKHIINGLMELHKHKIIHRDLKAENIMSHNGTYKIIDFGFSKKLLIAQENAEVKGTSLGTITTMAPQVMSKRPYGLKADIWSLGIIFFQMIYGIYPYDSITAPTLYQEIRGKKIFDKPNPLTISGFTPSQLAFDFIRFIIVFDTDERPNWKKVSEHPLLKESNDEVRQTFINQVQVIVDPKLTDNGDYKDSEVSNFNSQIDIKQSAEKKQQQQPIKMSKQNKDKKQRKQQQKIEIRQQERNIKHKQQNNIAKDKQTIVSQSKVKSKFNLAENVRFQEQEASRKKQQQALIFKRQEQQSKRYQEIRKLQQQRQLQERKQEQKKQLEHKAYLQKLYTKTGYSNVRIMNNEEAKLKEKEIDKEQNQQFQFTQKAHLQVLKTQFIYRQIINPLEVTRYLDDSKRTTIEFMYLLITRCFNNMSPIQFELETRHKNKSLINNLNNQITPLYNQVFAKFSTFSLKLTDSQNKFTSMFTDFFSKKIQKDKFSNKDKFLTGIQIENYSKQEQIDYICQYYNLNIKVSLQKINNLNNVIKRLNQFKRINTVTKEDLAKDHKSFEAYVKDILKQ